MKKATLAFVLFFAVGAAAAQDGPLSKGSLKFNLSYGVGSFVTITGGKTTFAPLTGSLEYALNENTTLGPVVGYAASEDSYTYSSLGLTDTYRFTNLLIGAKGNHYFSGSEKFEIYLGAMLGYNAVSMKLKSTSSRGNISNLDVESESGLFYGLHAGGRYRFSTNLAAHAELGYGIALLNLGLTFSIPKK